MTQTLGSIKVQVNNQQGGTVETLGTIKVQVNNQQGGTVRSISYGARTLKGATDLAVGNAVDGDSIIYNASTNSFVVAPVTVTAEEIIGIKGGTF